MKTVAGVGINDVDYPVKRKVNGVVQVCPFYQVWKNMIQRCYSEPYQRRQPTYKDCTVCDEWLTFSNFKSWMEKQDWEGKELDKDLKMTGNKVYSPVSCLFINKLTNAFMKDRAASRGSLPLGVSSSGRKYKGACSNPITKRVEHLGTFPTPHEAHQAWAKRKGELSQQVASLESNFTAAYFLIHRYYYDKNE